MRNCFIHIGAHKTGTTAIQHLLSRNSSALQEKGFYYPNAGRLEELPGHHNLAWEISQDDCFQNNYGAIEDLIAEVENRSEHVILSSEELLCSLHNSAVRFSNFVSLLQASGFQVTVILYLRSQIESLPRIYLMAMHSGMRLPFEEVLRPTLAKGSYEWEKRIYNFDYSDVLSRIEQIPNVNVIVRSYEQGRSSICSDFLSILNLTLQELRIDDEIFENVTLPVSFYLQTFMENRLGRALFDNELPFLQSLISPQTTEIELSPVVRLGLFERFRETNRNLFLQHGIPEPILRGEIQHDPNKTYIDTLFINGIEAFLLERLSAKVEEREGVVQSLFAQVAAKDADIQSFSNELAEKYGMIHSLSNELTEQRNIGQLLSNELAASHELTQTLSTQLAEQIRFLQLQSELSEARIGLLTTQLLSTETHLVKLETQLVKLTETLGFRLLNQYGRFKHRFLLPVYRLFGQASDQRAVTKSIPE